MGFWSGSAGFRDNIYSTDEGIEHADVEIGAYDIYMQSKMLKAAGVKVKKSLFFLRRPPPQLATGRTGVCMDDDDEMGRTSFKRKYRCRFRSDFADYPVPVPVAYHPMTHTVSVACTPLVPPLCCLRLPSVYIISFFV